MQPGSHRVAAWVPFEEVRLEELAEADHRLAQLVRLHVKVEGGVLGIGLAWLGLGLGLG